MQASGERLCSKFHGTEFTLKSSLHDSLLSRLSNDDNVEKNLSTFANEMATCAMILGK
jgi:DNA mismatch repair protein MSH4